MARPALLVDSGGLIAIANARDRLHRPMNLADTSMIWAAEHTGALRILTADRRDFEIYRTKTGRRLEILP